MKMGDRSQDSCEIELCFYVENKISGKPDFLHICNKLYWKAYIKEAKATIGKGSRIWIYQIWIY